MKTYQRLTQPLVRTNGELVPASWDEALTATAAGLAAESRLGRRLVLVLEGHERDEFHGSEVCPRRAWQQQHRQLQPHLTRSVRRRSGGSSGSGRRNIVV